MANTRKDRFTERLGFPRVRLDELIEAVSQEDRQRWEEMVRAQPPGRIPGIPYTEHNVEWVALRAHVVQGQIDPRFLRRMRSVDLEYLAGRPTPFADAPDNSTELGKLVENAHRAGRELQRRAAVRAGVLAAWIGAVVATSLTLVFR